LRDFSPIVLAAAIAIPLANCSGNRDLTATSCDDLTGLRLPDTTIALAETVAAGAFTPPKEFPAASMDLPVPYTALPSFCRVAASIQPSADSRIRFEVWMPAAEGWNGKFVGVGNGGFWGQIMYPRMGEPLSRGYAVASTDTGHEGSVDDGSFAVGHPEKLIDHGYRAVHEMTVQSKAIVAAHYGRISERSYWIGCSSGGRQGLKEAQRFPEDYDGISAGAPANDWVPLMASGVWIVQALTDPAGPTPKEKFAIVHDAAVAACDALDGVEDRVIADPIFCQFDPEVLRCAKGDGPDCLTAVQVESMRKIYRGAVNPRTGERIFPGIEPGGELELAAFFDFRIYENYWKQLVFNDPAWDLRTLDFDRDLETATEMDDGVLSATDPDLGAFVARGGKLFLWHGWNDTLITPRSTIDYYNAVVNRMGGQRVEDSVRLFLLPGVLHCRGGDGPDEVDHLAVLERWVEKGEAPDRVVARQPLEGGGERTRPLCPHPQVARYRGAGSTNDAASFDCFVPRSGERRIF
jgi:feruloyl esterase